MVVPDVAEHFQKAGFNALIYDPRSCGESEGHPRNDIDPIKQMSDYSDALSFLASQPSVRPTQLGFWGMSFSATVALCATALDRRAKCCVAVCPLLNYTLEKLPQVLARCMQDRSSQTVGENSPMFLPVYTSEGRSPVGLGFRASPEEIEFGKSFKDRGSHSWENKTTLQTYYKLVVWKPHAIMEHLHTSPCTPTMIVIPEKDVISPAQEQEALFERLPEPKTKHVATGKGHMDVLSGGDFQALVEKQAQWMRQQLGAI